MFKKWLFIFLACIYTITLTNWLNCLNVFEKCNSCQNIKNYSVIPYVGTLKKNIGMWNVNNQETCLRDITTVLKFKYIKEL